MIYNPFDIDLYFLFFYCSGVSAAAADPELELLLSDVNLLLSEEIIFSLLLSSFNETFGIGAILWLIIIAENRYAWTLRGNTVAHVINLRVDGDPRRNILLHKVWVIRKLTDVLIVSVLFRDVHSSKLLTIKAWWWLD